MTLKLTGQIIASKMACNAAIGLFLLPLCFQLKPVLCFLSPLMPGAVLTSAPELQGYAQGQTDTMLDVRLSIGVAADQLFAIDGFQFRLRNDPSLATGEPPVPLPGAHGPRPHLSSGAYEISAMKDGSFVNMEGTQNVRFRDGVWEMIWRDESPAGLIICGFSLDSDARRNENNVLEKGQVYLTWPVWSKDGLEKQQARKAEAEAKYRKFETERDNELEEMSNTPNILQKAMHFRNAAAATERMDFTGLHFLTDVPATEDVVEIGEELQIVKAGTVWTKTGTFSNSFRAHRQQLLGSAIIRVT
ncbi:hypothetical protein ACHAWF_011285 [Thalassiosira exigua]